jgi:Mg2+/Co2+ transporter CorB
VDANISLEEINRKLRLRLQAEGADRLAGWVTAHAGHIPQQDDVVAAQGVTHHRSANHQTPGYARADRKAGGRAVMLESILLLICFAAAWFFAGIETGVISINRLRLRHLVRRKVPGAETIQLFVRNTDLLFGTVLVGNNIACTVASITAVGLATERWGPRGAAAAGVLTTLIILIFCEFFPKAWFQSFPAARCLPFAPLLNAVRWC